MASMSNQRRPRETANIKLIREFQERLKALHEVTNHLTKAPNSDELYRKAIELGRNRLGFDRLGIWLLVNEQTMMQGTYGTDETGQIRDERQNRFEVKYDSLVDHALRNHVPLVFANNVALTD